MSINDNPEEPAQLVASLSGQEKEFLRGLVNGRSIIDMAVLCSVSVGEAKRIKLGLMKKLRAETMADAVRLGLMARIHKPS